MSVRIAGSTKGDGLSGLRMSLEASRQAHGLLFKPPVWRRIVKQALEDAGRWWTSEALPRRFTPFANELGYSINAVSTKLVRAGKMRKVPTPFGEVGFSIEGRKVRIMRWSAEVVRRVTAAYFRAVNTGQIRNNDDNRRAFFYEASLEMFRAMRRHAETMKDQVTPLVDRGNMREVTLSTATVKGTSTPSQDKLRISFSTDGQKSQMIRSVLQTVTAAEIGVMERVVVRSIRRQAIQQRTTPAPRGRAAIITSRAPAHQGRAA